ncbi:pantetheine-phosphate adenylyltransferase [Schaalia odontolytica]
MIALFPGSFDPFTNGHLDVAERVCAIAERLFIGVGTNPAKRGLIDPDRRVALIEEATAHLMGVEVVLLQGATMDEAARLGATLIVKGVRSSIDLDYEAPQAVFNDEVGGIDTWWIPTRPALAHVSSSAIRELLGLKKDISRYVPPAVERYLTDNRS